MPTFTLDQIQHPFVRPEDVERCYAIDVVLPDWGEALVSVQAFVGEFRKSIVSIPLAERLGFDVSSGSCLGQLVIQTLFEGDLVIHRSRSFELQFDKAGKRVGEAYIHLDLSLIHI